MKAAASRAVVTSRAVRGLGRPLALWAGALPVALISAAAISAALFGRRDPSVLQDGVFFVEPLSPNPTVVHDGQGNVFPAQQRQPIRHGDVVLLENSQIALKVIVREGEVSQ